MRAVIGFADKHMIWNSDIEQYNQNIKTDFV